MVACHSGEVLPLGFAGGSILSAFFPPGWSGCRSTIRICYYSGWAVLLLNGRCFLWLFIFSGIHSGAETLVTIPNTIVKGSSGEGTVYLTMGEQHGAGSLFTVQTLVVWTFFFAQSPECRPGNGDICNILILYVLSRKGKNSRLFAPSGGIFSRCWLVWSFSIFQYMSFYYRFKYKMWKLWKISVIFFVGIK